MGESSVVKDEEGGEEQSQATMKAESQDTSESDTKIHPLFNKGGAASKVGWTTSSTITSKQSTFIARSITVTSPTQAKATINALTSTHPSLKTASHNITAYRIILPSGSILEDSNDDGESKAGACILRVLKDHNLTNVLLVVSRWYGGIFLGPDRFRIMTDVAKDALAQRLRVAGAVGQDALWGLDLEGMRSENSPVTGDSLPIHRPEGARAYIMKAFACPPEPESEGKKKKKTAAQAEVEKQENLGMLFGALDLLFGSWVQHISKDELDRRAWGWYVIVRPEVEGGVAGWGGKGNVKLSDILSLRRRLSVGVVP
ncbi:ribosomal protein S5 domain 2-type protein [Tricladium varicosporioides]|nr:ribosomal protein S5 domain 2-type protein [Hymenoscyphus varicosporioides]